MHLCGNKRNGSGKKSPPRKIVTFGHNSTSLRVYVFYSWGCGDATPGHPLAAALSRLLKVYLWSRQISLLGVIRALEVNMGTRATQDTVLVAQ